MLKNSLYLRKQKRKVKVWAIKYRYLNLIALIAVFFVSASMLRGKNTQEEANAAAANIKYAIRSVETSENVYALTVDINGDEDPADVSLTFEVLAGLKVRAAVFASGEWLCDNKQTAKEMTEKGFEIGLLLSDDGSDKSREEIMLTAAKENEKYRKACGKYPRYVRVRPNADRRITEVLSSFRQYGVSFSLEVWENAAHAASCGDICLLGRIKNGTPYIAARFVSNMMSAGMTAVSLEELLYDIENETDAFGVQKK